VDLEDLEDLEAPEVLEALEPPVVLVAKGSTRLQ